MNYFKHVSIHELYAFKRDVSLQMYMKRTLEMNYFEKSSVSLSGCLHIIVWLWNILKLSSWQETTLITTVQVNYRSDSNLLLSYWILVEITLHTSFFNYSSIQHFKGHKELHLLCTVAEKTRQKEIISSITPENYFINRKDVLHYRMLEESM